MTTKTRPEDQDLDGGTATLGADELGEEGEKEKDDLDVEHVDDHAAHEDATIGRFRADTGQAVRTNLRPDGGDAHPDQVGCPGELDDIEQQVGFGHDGAEAEDGSGDMDEHAGLHPEGRNRCRLSPLIDTPGDDVEHVGTGHDDQQGGRHREGEQRGHGRHGGECLSG
jgi:hypothetical protein